MALLAESQLELGELGPAESSLKRAFEIVKETGEGWPEPEVHRVMAEMILRKPGADMPAAQQRFEEAVAIARKQRGKWWELRATVGLARLLTKQGRRDEAHAILAEIYGWFTEGFDNADLYGCEDVARSIERRLAELNRLASPSFAANDSGGSRPSRLDRRPRNIRGTPMKYRFAFVAAVFFASAALEPAAPITAEETDMAVEADAAHEKAIDPAKIPQSVVNAVNSPDRPAADKQA